MFAPVLLQVPGQMTRCPCGFGAYGWVDALSWNLITLQQLKATALCSLSSNVTHKEDDVAGTARRRVGGREGRWELNGCAKRQDRWLAILFVGLQRRLRQLSWPWVDRVT